MHGMGFLVTVVLIVETMPLGILVSALLDSSLRRRARFRLRLALFVVLQTAPALALIVGVALNVLDEQAVGELVTVCAFWVFASPVLMHVLLFHRPGRKGSPGESDDDDDHGRGPDPDRPVAPRPIGGIPLPDADPSPVRTRGPLPLGPLRRPRRRTHEPDRRPSRVLSSALLRSSVRWFKAVFSVRAGRRPWLPINR